jgi:hypothetical protein
MPRDKDEQDPKDPGVQGEGDYVSGRRYQKDARQFTKTHDTEKLAREAEPQSDDERREMAEAEQAGKSHAKGEKKKPGR